MAPTGPFARLDSAAPASAPLFPFDAGSGEQSGPLSAVGIVGGGQLAGMLAEAATALGVALHVQTPSADDPAAPHAASLVLAPIDDISGTRELARRCGAISFENEWIPLDALEQLAADGVRFVPGLHALRPLVCKRSQRQLLDDLHLPCPRWCPLEAVFSSWDGEQDKSITGSGPSPATPGAAGNAAPGSLAAAAADPAAPRLPEGFHFPVMAKAATGGYDGKGTRPLRCQADLEALLQAVDPATWILEEMVAFSSELALVACRDRLGNVACYPLVQTHQHQQVCDWVQFPAPVDHGARAFARNVAASLLTALDYVGVLSIEFFYGPQGLQVNELAPRTHNSGHYTIEASACSQFEQQLRIVAGLPMGSPEPRVPAALMVNLLGFESRDASGEVVFDLDADPDAGRRRALEALPGAHLHWYGKQGSRPGRKLGHITLLLEGGSAGELERQRQERLEQVRAIWPLPATTAP